MKPLDIKTMMAMIKDEPEDKYILVLKPVLLQALRESKHLRRKNSQLGGKVARYRKKDTPAYPFPAGNNACDYILCPNCRGIVGYNDMEDDEKDRCCCHCGQRLKWYE